MKKNILCLFLAVIGGVIYAQNELTVYAIKGPSGVALIQLFEKPPVVPGFNIKVEALAQADQMAARIIAGEIKIGVLPSNTAAKIAASGKAIQVAAVTGNGMLSLLSTDLTVKSIKDLKDKTLSVAGQGAVPEFVFRKILANNKVDAKSVQMDFSLAYPEIAASLIAGRIKTALLPEPFASMAREGNKEIRQIGDIQNEWRKAVKQANYPMTVIVVNSDFAKQNPLVVKSILSAIKDSVAWVIANPVEAGNLVEKHSLGLKAAVVAASVPKSNYVYAAAPAARKSLDALYRIFLEFEPSSIGGKLPDDSFYLELP
ncbi:MAG: ABC transporter substrate-binding protein [Spirochaetaceae bacterium]|jgi:NitT/TauT family transport system substrate-binding protein|nr:ABC transporter substrate-binding protein [Spirochaetaceae bacterium]